MCERGLGAYFGLADLQRNDTFPDLLRTHRKPPQSLTVGNGVEQQRGDPRIGILERIFEIVEEIEIDLVSC